MSLLSVVVKQALINDYGTDGNFNTYVVLKIGSVKSSTLPLLGVQPGWQEEFCFELDEFDTGLTIELWNRGILWDNLLGLHWLPLVNVNHSNVDHDQSNEVSISLDSELCLRDGKIIGTQIATGHKMLISAKIDLSAAGMFFTGL
jgi:hypothetical protein